MIPLLLLATTLVLRSGDRISVEGTITESAGRVVFRAIDGTLYSLASSEIESIDTQAPATAPAPEKKKLKLSAEERERLLRELESNHEGVAAPVEQRKPAVLPPAKDQTEEEWQWRRESRAQRELAQFRDDARKRGIMPGWLR